MKNKNMSDKILYRTINNFAIGDKVYVKADDVESIIIGGEILKNDASGEEIWLYHTIKDMTDEQFSSALLTKDLKQEDYYRILPEHHFVRTVVKNFVKIPITITVTCNFVDYKITTNPKEDDVIIIGEIANMDLFVVSYSMIRPDINDGKSMIGLTVASKSQFV